MIKYFLLLLLPFTIYASKILSYNIYDRSDRVDVMITFDTPFDGVIKQSFNNSKIVIKLEGASIESSKIKKVSSNFLQSLTITPLANYTQLVASVGPLTKLQASKTADSYGLRLRFTNQSTSKNSVKESSSSSTSLLPTKKDDDMSRSYYIVVAILIIGIMILLYLKKKMALSTTKPKETTSWLFKDNKEPGLENSTDTSSLPQEDVKIRFQKNLDNKNNVVMLDFAEQSYLVLMGSNNILLDKFLDNKPQTQEDFDTILQNRHQELDDFLQVDNSNPTQKSDTKEALQAYKERAASIIYDT